MNRMVLAASMLAVALAGGSAPAQTAAINDRYATDPVGIVADPSPAHPQPANGAEWEAW